MALHRREPQGPKSIEFSVDVAGTPTDFVATDFGSQVFFVITQNGKIGSLIEATSQECREVDMLGERTFEVKVLFGDRRLEHYRAYARALIEVVAAVDSSKSILLGIALKEHSPEGFRQVVREVKDRIGPVAAPPPAVPEVVPP